MGELGAEGNGPGRIVGGETASIITLVVPIGDLSSVVSQMAPIGHAGGKQRMPQNGMLIVDFPIWSALVRPLFNDTVRDPQKPDVAKDGCLSNDVRFFCAQAAFRERSGISPRQSGGDLA